MKDHGSLGKGHQWRWTKVTISDFILVLLFFFLAFTSPAHILTSSLTIKADSESVPDPTFYLGRERRALLPSELCPHVAGVIRCSHVKLGPLPLFLKLVFKIRSTDTLMISRRKIINFPKTQSSKKSLDLAYRKIRSTNKTLAKPKIKKKKMIT